MAREARRGDRGGEAERGDVGGRHGVRLLQEPRAARQVPRESGLFSATFRRTPTANAGGWIGSGGERRKKESRRGASVGSLRIGDGCLGVRRRHAPR